LAKVPAGSHLRPSVCATRLRFHASLPMRCICSPAALLAAAALQGARVHGYELHRGHEAEHVTELRRRAGAGHSSGAVQVEVGVDWQRIVNFTTKLRDMVSEYTGYIGVGTSKDGGPAFKAQVVFDTGSTNLWVASVLCKAFPCTARQSKGFYDPTHSLSQEPYGSTGGDIDIMFGTGELKGPLHVDTYRVGPMTVPKQPFAMIREMNGEVFESFPFQGILGLGFPSLSFAGIEPFFDRVIKQKLLQNNEFAFYLNGIAGQPSALLWGGVDKDLYEPPIHMFPVVQAHYWALELVDVRMGNKSLVSTGDSRKVKRVIIDSGTTYFTAPSEVYSEIVSKAPEARCDKVNNYESLTYVLRDVQGKLFDIVVTQETYMIANLDGSQCRPAFMKLDVSRKYGPAMILGEVFMRRFFTVFSRGNGSLDQARIGLARARMGAIPKERRRRPPASSLQAVSIMRHDAGR